MNITAPAFGWLFDFVFPIRCAGCGMISSGKTAVRMCRDCFASINPAPNPACIGCDSPSSHGATCPACAGSNGVDQVFAAGSYADPLLRRMVTAMKYRFIPELADSCAELIERAIVMAPGTEEIFKNDPLITAVPLHPYRLNWRGFNQAELIARRIGQNHGIAFIPLLKRTRRTAAQAGIGDSAERALNTGEAFACTDASPIANRNIIIVDDVCTSGATLNECAKSLKSAGAKSVIAVVAARG